MTNEENKKTKKELDENVPEETAKDDDAPEVPPKKEDSDVGEATFEEVVKSKKSLTFSVIIVLAVITLAVILFYRGFGGQFGNEKYVNPSYGYSYSYTKGMQLVAEGNIPPELASQGIKTMADLNLTEKDSLLVHSNPTTGDNVVYTTLELSSRDNYTGFDSYIKNLFVSLDESKAMTGTEYTRAESTVGKGIPSIQYTFEMEVPVDNTGKTRTGVFYDNLFETEDGQAYSISFGYPKDVDNAEEYMNIYQQILKSFRVGTPKDLPVEEGVDTAGVVTEKETQEIPLEDSEITDDGSSTAE